MSVTAAKINELLSSEEHIGVHGHHTFRIGDDTFTTVDTTDSLPLCSEECLASWAATVNYPLMRIADVMFEHEVYAVPHYVDPVTLRSAVAFPFSPSSDVNFNIICENCGSLMFAGSPMTVRYLDDAFRTYLVTALWSSINWGTSDDGEGDRPLDEDYEPGDIDEDSADELLSDLVRFFARNYRDARDLDPNMVGMDLWLTQNGHGAGFWDRGLGDVGERLSKSARFFGSQELFVDVNGKLSI